MSSDPLTLIQARAIVQSEQADPRQQRNAAGGYVFAVDELARLRRFLVMGTVGGTYYTGERELTKENATALLDLIRTRGPEVVAEIVMISTAGRAPKQNPAIFALAACAGLGDDETRSIALDVLPQVARTGTHLFLFAQYVEQFRGWGRGLRRAIGGWYLSKPVDRLAYQLIKYRQRNGWTHRDLLRLSHPTFDIDVHEDGDTFVVDEEGIARRLAFEFACGRLPAATAELPTAFDSLRLIEGFQRAQASPSANETARLIQQYPGLPWEALIPEHLNSPAVWVALLEHRMPQTALMRNLPKLTQVGLLSSAAVRANVCEQLATGMAQAKVHPVNVLVALRTYASGRSLRGSATWQPVRQVTDALDAGFYQAFGGVEPSGKRTLIALDVSGSMGYQNIAGLPITPREASAAMAMVTMATEPDVEVVGFTSDGSRSGWGWRNEYNGITPLDLSPRRRLDDVISYVSRLPFGGTDCALPWTWALETGREFDVVSTWTDNETWAGPVHVHQAIRRYREQTGIPARSIVAGMTATSWTVNDPADPLSLDVAGFDSAVPNLIADFSAGRI
jgi:60 kDa SS-A/Ro ribonucleoprotein